MELTECYEDEVRLIQSKPTQLEELSVSRIFDPVLEKLKNNSDLLGGDSTLSKSRLAAVISIVINSSVLFTTRDWSVTGTLSTMAGAMIAASDE